MLYVEKIGSGAWIVKSHAQGDRQLQKAYLVDRK